MFSSLSLDRGNSSDLNWYKCSLQEGVLDRFQMMRLKMCSEGSVGYNAEINKAWCKSLQSRYTFSLGPFPGNVMDPRDSRNWLCIEWEYFKAKNKPSNSSIPKKSCFTLLLGLIVLFGMNRGKTSKVSASKESTESKWDAHGPWYAVMGYRGLRSAFLLS